MMHLNVGKGNLKKGNLELGNLIFDENHIEVAIDIVEMSEDLKVEFDKMIEVEKENYISEMKKYHSDCPKFINRLKWCNEPVIIMTSFLQVNLEVGKPIQYRIVVGFMDAADEFMDSVVSMDVDLSEYEAELKKVISKSLIDRFF